jgi:hypothetical protein
VTDEQGNEEIHDKSFTDVIIRMLRLLSDAAILRQPFISGMRVVVKLFSGFYRNSPKLG